MAGLALHRLRIRIRPFVPRGLHALATRATGRLVARALAGDAVSCPCCGATLKRFISYPSLYCPRCGSYERHRLLALYFERRPELLTPPLDLLQVSPDRPLERFMARKGIQRTTIDLDNPGADLSMDVHELAFADRSFDIVLCSAVLDAVADQPRALAELKRVLRPGGRAIFQVRVPEQPRLRENVEALGFNTEIVRAADFGASAQTTFALVAEEQTYVCRMPD